jgi:hypothetical protein
MYKEAKTKGCGVDDDAEMMDIMDIWDKAALTTKDEAKLHTFFF